MMTSHAWTNDPKRLAFTLARYGFVAKMLVGREAVLEVGCADAWGTRVVQQAIGGGLVTAIDFDEVFVEEARQRIGRTKWPIELAVHDMAVGSFRPHGFDGLFALDVLEHIDPGTQHRFLANCAGSLRDGGTAIFGMPSLESQAYASPISKAGHVNCQSMEELRATLQRHFDVVFMFGMNDAVLHTGFGPMCHYLFGLCVGPRQ